MNKKTIAQRVVEQYSTVNQIDSIATFASVFWSLKFGQHFTDHDLFTLHDVIFDPINSYSKGIKGLTIRYGHCGLDSTLEIILRKTDDSYRIKMTAYSIVECCLQGDNSSTEKVLKQDKTVETRIRWVRDE